MTTTPETAGLLDRTWPTAPAAGSGRRANLVLLVATLLGLVLRLYQLTRPGFLSGVTEYDDGAYFGSAVRLLTGAVPYRDFVMVQPPGITWLLAPLALLAKATTTSTGFAVARVMTALAGAAGVPLAGLLVRRRGALATAVVCGTLAVYPSGVNAAHTVLLEPWLVLFCLLGALAVFDGSQIAAGWPRLAWGGAAFGFGVAIKLWAVLPALVVLVLLLVLCGRRRGWTAYLGGFTAGFGIPMLPVFVLAPHAVIHDAIVAQLARVDLARLPVWDRLASLTGLSPFSPVGRGVIVATGVGICALVLSCLAVAWRRDRRWPDALETFALVTAVLVLAAFLWPPDYYLHYGWFFAPFLALSVGLSLAGAAAGWPSSSSAPSPASSSVSRSASRAGFGVRRLVSYLLIAGGVAVVAVMMEVQLRQETRLRGDDSPLAVRAVIPAGACVLTDIPSLTISADRFASAVHGCSTMVDPIGTDYALSGGENGVTGASRSPAVRHVWLSAFAHAGYVWLACGAVTDPRCKTNRRIPWTPALLAYFRHHFKPVRTLRTPPGLYVRDRAANP